MRRQRLCRDCRLAYMREYRYFLVRTEEQKRKEKCRDRARYLVRRGKIKRRNCTICGHWWTEMHHPDYSRPELVIWFCRYHHRWIEEFDDWQQVRVVPKKRGRPRKLPKILTDGREP